MYYLGFLEGLHERLLPRTYLEVGVDRGYSLALSRCRSIGVDPSFQIEQQLIAPTSLIRSTSDEYFERLARDGATPFGDLPIDLSFVDGMHSFECVLSDFIAIERYSAATSVVAFDDVLPRNVDEAARQQHTQAWTGDVFRLQFALAALRPDLVQIAVDTQPTGTLVVYGLDPSSTVLREGFDDIVRQYVEPDPQPIPPEILERTHAIDPEAALARPIWDELRAARTGVTSATAPAHNRPPPATAPAKSRPRSAAPSAHHAQGEP